MPPIDIPGPLDITYAGLVTAIGAKYTKPVGGIPQYDLTAAVQAKLDKSFLIEQRLRPVWATDFLVATNSGALDPFIGTAVATGTANQPNINSLDHPGVVRLLSSTSANSGYLIGTNLAQIQIGGGEVYDVIFYIDALANNTTRLGFIDTAASTDCTDGVYIEIDASGVATGKTAAAGVRSSSGTTGAITAATWYHAHIELNAAGTLATFTIYSMAGAVLWSATLATTIPVTAGQLTGAGFIITNSQTSAITLAHLDYMAVAFTRTLVRGGVS